MQRFSGRFSSKSKLLRTVETFVSGIFGLVNWSRRCWWGLALDLLPRYRPEAGPSACGWDLTSPLPCGLVFAHEQLWDLLACLRG